jgi:histidyl-tRNA synthetase
MTDRSIQTVRGMNDILPEQVPLWSFFEEAARDWLQSYGYRELRLPILERTELFVRSIGEVTDIVEKEMYTFVDQLNQESLTLRPEGTASCVRAVLEHNLLYGTPQRLYYTGPMFRHERPQKGRYRQFHQVGVEAMGFSGPDIDFEHIVMCARLWRRLELADVRLQLNTLGNSEERARYRGRLIEYLRRREAELDADSKRRLHSNPLRVLDSKNPAMAEVIAGAPRLSEDLGEASAAHFEQLKGLLREAEIGYEINPRLVRGLDYYNLTVTEWVTTRLGAQGTICAGGRYDGLIEQLGGKPQPACGFAIGVERVLALMRETERTAPLPAPDVYLVHQGESVSAFALQAAEHLRECKLAVIFHCGGGSFKSQLRRADASGARYAVIIGEEEAGSGEVTVKPMRVAKEQVRVPLSQAVELIKQA